MPPYLTPEEIEQTKIPYRGIFELVVYHDPTFWVRVNNYNLPSPVRLRFNDTVRDAMPQNIRDGKGIYMFFIEPEHPLPTEVYFKHLLYIGRVLEGTSSFNFYKRFYDYVKGIGNKTQAVSKQMLTNLWPNCTFVYYFDLSGRTDAVIADIESNLFNNIVPPLNAALHGASRNTRTIY